MKKLWGLTILLTIAIGAIGWEPVVKARTGGSTMHRSWRWRSLPDIKSGLVESRGGLVQEGSQKKPVCAPGEAVSGDLGYAGTECHGCMISGKHVLGEPDIEFDAEPILSGIRKDGPADGKLAEQDVLVAIDGQDITTRAAAVHLSWLEPGKPVRLTVRRAGVLTDVEITPTAGCRGLTVARPPFIIMRRRVWQ